MPSCLSAAEASRLSEAAQLLREAERTVRVLRTISWPAEVEAEFFAGGASRPPRVEYVPLDPVPVLVELAAARRRLVGDGPVDAWLRRCADAIERGARMLAAVGTRDFHRLSCELYGAPADALADGQTTSLAIAESFAAILAEYTAHPPNFGRGGYSLTDQQLADGIAQRLAPHFGAEAPAVELVGNLPSRAVAGARYIRIRRGESFTDLDLHQLLAHEAHVHIATTLNGVAQERFPILAAGHPGTTRTQEGLAVFSELITGAIDPLRFARLARRTLAIQQAIDGADFMELYRGLLAAGQSPGDAFDDARRVVRGGLLTGGAPFTKDATYLYGLLTVHNFMRVAVRLGRFDCLLLLFCGKLDLADVPALATLAETGLLVPPRFLHPRVADPRFLIAYLGYSNFLNAVHLPAVVEHLREQFAQTPRAELMACPVPITE